MLHVGSCHCGGLAFEVEAPEHLVAIEGPSKVGLPGVQACITYSYLRGMNGNVTRYAVGRRNLFCSVPVLSTRPSENCCTRRAELLRSTRCPLFALDVALGMIHAASQRHAWYVRRAGFSLSPGGSIAIDGTHKAKLLVPGTAVPVVRS